MTAGFSAFFTNDGTLGTTASADADLIDTVFTLSAFFAEIAIPADAVKANAALTAQFIICAIRTFFAAFGTDFVSTFRTALTADTDVGHAIFTLIAVIAVIALSADTVVTDAAGTADPVRTVFTLFIAFRTDKRTL